jgi:hypothetical protein
LLQLAERRSVNYGRYESRLPVSERHGASICSDSVTDRIERARSGDDGNTRQSNIIRRQ